MARQVETWMVKIGVKPPNVGHRPIGEWTSDELEQAIEYWIKYIEAIEAHPKMPAGTKSSEIKYCRYWIQETMDAIRSLKAESAGILKNQSPMLIRKGERDMTSGRLATNKTETVEIEGLMVSFGKPDNDGDQLVPGGVDTDGFMASGYFASLCDVAPKASDFVGHPTRAEERPDGIHIKGMVHDPALVQLFHAKADLGFAISGIVHKREKIEGGSRITKCEIKSVAILPLDKVTDPRCRCRMVQP